MINKIILTVTHFSGQGKPQQHRIRSLQSLRALSFQKTRATGDYAEGDFASLGPSKEGRQRCDWLAAEFAAQGVRRLYSSLEPKTLETAALVAVRMALPLVPRADLHENDRTGLGSVSYDELSLRIHQFYEQPAQYVIGAETANRAFKRFATAVEGILSVGHQGPVAIITHGTVLSLFVALKNTIDPFDLWSRLTLPSYVALDASFRFDGEIHS